jgi:hypothetical protein
VEVLNLYPYCNGGPGDIAVIAVFLASDESRMLTGTNCFKKSETGFSRR